MKRLSDTELDSLIAGITPTPEIHIPFNRAQKVGFLLGVLYPAFVHHLDMGCGKTGLTLELLHWHFKAGRINRTLVLAPTDEILYGWEDEIRRWGINLPYLILTGSGKRKWDLLLDFKAGLALTSYMGWSTMVSRKMAVQTKQDGSEASKYVPDDRLLDMLAELFDALVLDECFLPGTLITTTRGYQPIEDLKVGDLVVASDLKPRRIKTVIKKRSNVISRIFLEDGKVLEATPNHPYLTDLGWICASNLEGRLLYDTSDMRDLWNSIQTEEARPTDKSILRTILLSEIGNGSEVFQSNYQLEQGDSDVGVLQSQAKCHSKKNEPQTAHTRWQREILTTATKTDAFRVRPAMGARICHFIGATAARLSNELQSRHSRSNPENSDRDRWLQPRHHHTQTARQEKGAEAGGIRVVRVENIKFDRPKDVYSLEIEDCPHFFAGGYLVHNCTRGPAYPDNLTFQAIKPISEAAKVRYGLAGRLFGKDPMPVWGQFYLIDHGASFGDSFGLFREVFFKSKRGYFGGIEYKFDNAREDVLYKYLANRSLYYNIDEISDLPEVIRTTRMCYFPDDTEVYYRRCVEEIISQKKNATVMKNTFLRMRQLSSGFVGVALDEEDPDYDDGGTATIEFPDNPKLDLLLELIQQLPEDRKAIIYHEFTWSGKKISEALTKAKIKHGWLWGGTKNWNVIKERFNNSPDYRVLLVNWKKGGYGLNLQAANYGFFYESPLSIIDRDQCERRMRRTGQRHPVFITDLVVRNSIDHRILQAHQEGRDLWDDVMRNPELLNRED